MYGGQSEEEQIKNFIFTTVFISFFGGGGGEGVIKKIF